ncbi:MAG: membrane protein insertase YidC [Pseudomonadota bacterium]|nr:membrane protein insertase YidC [Pseudomonadota bacterium]
MEQKNLLLAIVLSVAIMFGWQFYLLETAPPKDAVISQKTKNAVQDPPLPGLEAPGTVLPLPAGENVVDSPIFPGSTKKGRLNSGPRITIESPRITGSISLTGARFDDLILEDYRETIEEDSEKVRLLNRFGMENPYFVYYGWISNDTEVPPLDAIWSANRRKLTPNSPVTLTWKNKSGVVFEQIISLDENYMFSVRQSVRNGTSSAITIFPFGQVVRKGTPDVLDFYILHEGLLGVFNGVLKEVDYDDLQDPKQRVISNEKSKGGWIGITDKYWLTALIPDQTIEYQSRFSDSYTQGKDHYRTDFTGPGDKLASGASSQYQSRLFAGAKEANLILAYRDNLNIDRFDLAIDWGWFEWLTKPLFFALVYFTEFLGNMGLSILLVTVVIKLIFFPLANKSYKAMAKMKALQPEMLKIRERFGEDRMRMNQEMMALYKKEKANPASGCLPILPQIPVFFALYKVVFVTIEMRHAPFFGWIQDLSAADPLTFVNLFGLVPWTPPEYLVIGIWPIIMGATMYLQQKLNPPPPDPMQAKIFMFLPFIFTIMLARFPSGLVIYWAWNNALSILQQYVIMRRAGVPIGGGKVKTNTKS